MAADSARLLPTGARYDGPHPPVCWAGRTVRAPADGWSPPPAMDHVQRAAPPATPGAATPGEGAATTAPSSSRPPDRAAAHGLLGGTAPAPHPPTQPIRGTGTVLVSVHSGRMQTPGSEGPVRDR